MRNFLDTASIAQSLDGERLMGSLRFPDRRIVSDQFRCKEAGYTMRRDYGPDLVFSCRRIRCMTLILREFVSTIATSSSTALLIKG